MRLVLNGRFLGRPITGVERLAIQLTRAVRDVLADIGERDVDVLVPPRLVDRPQAAAVLGDPVPRSNMVGRLSGHPWEQLDLPRARRDAWLLSLCNVGPMMRRRQAVVICDALFIEQPGSFSRTFRWWYRTLLTVLSRRARVVFTISDHSRLALERHGLVPRGKTHMLHLGVDHMYALETDETILERLQVVPRRYVLAIGSLARHKNLRLLVDAFVAAGLEGVDLVIAGGGNPRIFQDAGLPTGQHIRYTGRVGDGELKALYAGALAFACPSLSEGFGLPALEAMTVGCPVIATTGGAVPEICGDAAIYADPSDRAAWRDALRRIVDDPALRADLAQRALSRAAGFTWRRAATQMLTVLARADGDAAMLAALESSIDVRPEPRLRAGERR